MYIDDLTDCCFQVQTFDLCSLRNGKLNTTIHLQCGMKSHGSRDAFMMKREEGSKGKNKSVENHDVVDLIHTEDIPYSNNNAKIRYHKYI